MTRRLMLGLIGEPVFKHLSREADVAPDTQAWEPAGSHRLIDPAGPDRQFVGRLLRSQQWPGAEQRHLDG